MLQKDISRPDFIQKLQYLDTSSEHLSSFPIEDPEASDGA